MRFARPAQSTPRRRRGIRPQSAYTMVELVIVVLIISILTAVAAPRYLDSLERHGHQSAVNRIVADLQYARRRAQRTSQPQTVVFDLPNNRYMISGANTIDRRGRAFEVSLGGNDFQSSLQSADFGGNATLTFDIYGRPVATGTVVVSAGSVSETIAVNTAGLVTRE